MHRHLMPSRLIQNHLETTAATLHGHKAVAMLPRHDLGRVSRLRHVGAKSDSASDTEERQSWTEI